MDNYFWIDSTRNDEYGVRLQGPVVFGQPEPNIKTQSVPGRNGDLHFFDGSYNNVKGKVSCFVLSGDGAADAVRNFARACLMDPGYHRLETSEEPGYYRLARVSKGPKTEIRQGVLAPFDLEFDCKPQAFLAGGESEMQVPASGSTIYNDYFASTPLIRVSMAGESGTVGGKEGAITVNGTSLTLKNASMIYLDCEVSNAYSLLGNPVNHLVKAESGYPMLQHGENIVSWSGDIDAVYITPRWWTL